MGQHAHDAIELTTLNFSNTNTPHAQPGLLAPPPGAAAGCNDPLVVYLHYRFADAKHGQRTRAGSRVGPADEDSAYPPIARPRLLENRGRKAERQRYGSQSGNRTLLNPSYSACLQRLAGRAFAGLETLVRARDTCKGYEQLGIIPWNHGSNRPIDGHREEAEAARISSKATRSSAGREARGQGHGDIPKERKSFQRSTESRARHSKRPISSRRTWLHRRCCCLTPRAHRVAAEIKMVRASATTDPAIESAKEARMAASEMAWFQEEMLEFARTLPRQRGMGSHDADDDRASPQQVGVCWP